MSVRPYVPFAQGRRAIVSRLASHPNWSDAQIAINLNVGVHIVRGTRVAMGLGDYPDTENHATQQWVLLGACMALGIKADTEFAVNPPSRRRADLVVQVDDVRLVVELKTGTAQPDAVRQVRDYAAPLEGPVATAIVAREFSRACVKRALREGVSMFTGESFIRSVLVPIRDVDLSVVEDAA